MKISNLRVSNSIRFTLKKCLNLRIETPVKRKVNIVKPSLLSSKESVNNNVLLEDL